jgi:hypothetical protein
LGRLFFEATLRLRSLRPDDLLATLKMVLSIDLRDSVSLFSPIQATRFLTFSSMGLPPTEHISLSFFTGHAGAQYPAHLYPCLRFAEHLAVRNAKLGAEQFATPFS